MLHLRRRTEPAWGDAAIAQLDEILLDHAHCEKKAAATAIGLVFRYPEHAALAVPLARLAREELEHFERVVELVEARGGRFGRAAPAPYAPQLLAAVRTREPERALDTLLCCALIEARSCDRMQVLHAALERARTRGDARIDMAVVDLYGDLLACEARHHGAYVELARTIVDDRAMVDARLLELADHEAEVIAAAPVLPRLHAAMA